MKLKSFSFRNIGPYGNRIVDIELRDEGGLWFIYGKNGNGKSTLLNITKALYYGKVDKLKKDEIANRFNKHGWMMGTVESPQGNVYTIERTFSPSSLTVLKDGVDLDISGISKGQQFIDNEVTKMPYQIYSNIVSLSINDFKSFLVLTPKEKREIIDRIFGIDVINRMSVLVKGDMKDSQYKVDMINRDLSIIAQNIASAKLKLELYIKEKQETDSRLLDDIDIELSDILTNNSEVQTALVALTSKSKEIQEMSQKLFNVKCNLSNERSNIENYKAILENHQCPTCLSNLDTPDNEAKIQDMVARIAEVDTNISKVIEAEKALQTKYEAICLDSQTLNNKLHANQARLANLNNKKSEISENKSDTIKMLQDIITSDTVKLNEKSIEVSQLTQDIYCLNVVDRLCGADGVKQSIIETFLPLLNREISTTLEHLGFPYDVKFDKDFEPNLEHLGIKISPESLSTGERKRVDLAVLIAIIRVMKRKYPHLNLFMLDEVLSSIDQDGVRQIISFLHDTAKELRINIFMVNHAPLPMEYFEKSLHINKKDNFSEIEVIDL